MSATNTIRNSRNAAWASALHNFKRREWADRICQINTSGKTKKKWAEENGFAPATVYHWYSVLKREAGGDLLVKQGMPVSDHFYYPKKIDPKIQEWIDHMKELVHVDVYENDVIFSRNDVTFVVPKSKLTIEVIVRTLTDISKM